MSEYSYGDQIKDMTRIERERGLEVGRQLAKYQGVLNLRKEQALEIINILWGEAPLPDKMAAAALCASYHLNPLAGHVFLIPFENKETKEVTWARVIGIKATRLLASRRGAYSYEDFSPRLMSEAEQIKVWGKVDTTNLCYITIVKDCRTSAQAYGFGKWPKGSEPKGTNKGNTKDNMASIRSERQALDRLRPGEMPEIYDVVDEKYIDGDYRELTHEADIIEQAEKDIKEFWPDTISKTSLNQQGSHEKAKDVAEPSKQKAEASSDEAIKDEAVEKITDDQFTTLAKFLGQEGNLAKIRSKLREYGWNVKTIKDLTTDQAKRLIEELGIKEKEVE